MYEKNKYELDPKLAMKKPKQKEKKDNKILEIPFM